MPFAQSYAASTVTSTTVETTRTVVLTKPAGSNKPPLDGGTSHASSSSTPTSVEGKLVNGFASEHGGPRAGSDGCASQNSAVTAPDEDCKEDTPAKDVEKERHYNAFMEARLKLGQTRTVAEPLKKLKAVQQQQTDVKVLRRGSAPVFSQAMLRRPSERRQSMVKNLADAKIDGAKIENGKTPAVNGVQDVTPSGRAKSKTPPDVRGSSRSSPVKSKASSTYNGTSMNGVATTVVTLADVAKKEEVALKIKKAPTTLRLTKKPPLDSTEKSNVSEASKADDKLPESAKETTDVKKPLGLKRSSLAPIPVRRRVPTSKGADSQESSPAVNAVEKCSVAADGTSKGDDKSTTSPCLENQETTVVKEVSSSEEAIQEERSSKATINGLTSTHQYKEAIEVKTSYVQELSTTKTGVTSPESCTGTVSASSAVTPKEVKSDVVGSKRAEQANVSSGTVENEPKAVETAEPTNKTSKHTEETTRTTMVRGATFSVESSASSAKKTAASTVTNCRAVEAKTQMQKVDIKDLRTLLRTPSPQPPKEDDLPMTEDKQSSRITERRASKTRAGLPRSGAKPTEESMKGHESSGAIQKFSNTNGHLNESSQTKTVSRKLSATDERQQSRFLKSNKPSTERKYSKTSYSDDYDDLSPPGSISEASTSGVSSMSGSIHRDSGAPTRRPSTLSWDSDAFSTATLSPCDVANHRSRSISVESADLDDALYKPRSSSSTYRSMLTGKWTKGMQLVNLGSSAPQVSELWSDLTQEQAASVQAAEMLDAESAERMRLEKEVRELQSRCSQLQQQKDRIEMEVSETRMMRSLNTEANGDISDEDDVDGISIYKQKYERVLRESEMKKRKMSQQHEDEVEKLMMSRKAAEKKLAEALDDVEEGRQAVNAWKRKAQKLTAELQDLQLMVEEHMGRNAELERKQRKFDGELSVAMDNLKQERYNKDKILREKEVLYADKLSLEQELETVRMELEMQHSKVSSLHKELDELTFSSHGEEEVAKLKRAKQELDRKSRDQEEELEDLAGQVQLLEQSKLRLEMALEKQRQEHRREVSTKEEELDEARAAAAKKLRNLEALLEQEQEERHALGRQKNELERRLAELSERPPPRDPEIERRLRRDLRRTRALLRDAQGMLEHARDGQATRTIVRQLKNQLEDAEFAKTVAVKARQGAEMELQEVQTQLEEVLRVKNESEGRCLQLNREKGALQIQLEEIEEEQAELMKKYKTAVQQMASDQKVISEQSDQIIELESEKHHLKEQVHDLSSKVEHMTSQAEDSHVIRRLESRVRDLESKLELEQTSKARLEGQVQRLKDQCNRLQDECNQAITKEQQTQENCRKLQRQLRDLREDCTALQHREAEAQQRCHELEMALDNAEADLQGTKNDLKLACQRIQDLQTALEEDLDSGTDILEESESDEDEDDVDVDSILKKHGLSGIGAKTSAYCLGGGDSPANSRRNSNSASFALNLTRALSLDYPL